MIRLRRMIGSFGMKGTMSEMEFLGFPAALDRGDEGASRRTLPHRGCGLCEGQPRHHRERSRPPSSGSRRACVSQVHGACTIRQVLVWLRQEKIPLPVLSVGEAADRSLGGPLSTRPSTTS